MISFVLYYCIKRTSLGCHWCSSFCLAEHSCQKSKLDAMEIQAIATDGQLLVKIYIIKLHELDDGVATG